MTTPVSVVDLFAGPGGLAEGFAGFRGGGGGKTGSPPYRVDLSVENDPHAHRTLCLRAFLRKFEGVFPHEYYKHLADAGSEEPSWSDLYPDEWRAAQDETPLLTLGTLAGRRELRSRLETIKARSGGWAVLIGGPPCQAYSVAGRVRNAGNPGYDPRKDKRYHLYRDYVEALRVLHPAVFVLENVPGLLSASLGGRPIVDGLLRALRDVHGTGSYRLCPVSASPVGEPMPADFIVRAEEHGVPQARHRVIVVGLRRDVAETLDERTEPRLAKGEGRVTARQVLGAMPRLRSGLSRGDCPRAWKAAVHEVGRRVLECGSALEWGSRGRFQDQIAKARRTLPDEREADDGGVALPDCPGDLRDWLLDPGIGTLPNNRTRKHMLADLGRYLFAASFGRALGWSPKTVDFPDVLAPSHRNWRSGNFADRFRVVLDDRPAQTVTSHLAKDGNYFIHPDPGQCRSLTVREAARLQTFPDNYLFKGPRTQQYAQVGNAVPPFLARQIAGAVWRALEHARRKACARGEGRVRVRAMAGAA